MHSFEKQLIQWIGFKALNFLADHSQDTVIIEGNDGSFLQHGVFHLVLEALAKAVGGGVEALGKKLVVGGVAEAGAVGTVWGNVGGCEKAKVVFGVGVVGDP